jgi:hypothetical protein
MVTAAPQLMRSINGFDKAAIDTDGSIDLYFGPQKPANVADSNWIQSAYGRDFLLAFASMALVSSSTFRAGSWTTW